MVLDIKFLVINCLGYYDSSLSAFDILIFALGSFIIISILLLYYSKISKSNISKSELDNPIYLSKDALFQTTNSDTNLIFVYKTTSKFTKLLVYTMIIIVTFTPLYQLLVVEHFVS